MTENEASVRLEVIRAGLLSGTDVKVVSSEENIKFIDAAIDAIEENQQYRTIGTLEECRAAVEKQTARRPDYEGDGYADGHLVYDTWICPCCGKHYEVDYDNYNYCPDCGQKLDWSDEE